MLNSSATQTSASGGSMQIRRRQEFFTKSLNATAPEESIPALHFPDSKFIFLLFFLVSVGNHGGTGSLANLMRVVSLWPTIDTWISVCCYPHKQKCILKYLTLHQVQGL